MTISSTETAISRTREGYWPIAIVRNYALHLTVIAFFALYPLLHGGLTASPIGAEAAMLLPSISAMIPVFYFGLFAMSFDFMSGYTGYLSFGHVAFYGTGAYFVVLVANGKVPFLASSTPFMLSLVLAGLVAAMLAIAMGMVAFRLTGVYFAMITLGIAEVLHVFVENWEYVSSSPQSGASITEYQEGFAIGVPFVSELQLKIGQLRGDSLENVLGLGIDFSSLEVSYFMIGLVVLVCYVIMKRILNSPFGLSMVSIRENEQRAEALSYDTFRFKMGAFAASAFFAGVAGGLYAGFSRSVAPGGTFLFLLTGFALVATIIGGFNTLAGPFFGWLVYETLNEFLTKDNGGLLPYFRDHASEGLQTTQLPGGFTVSEFFEVVLNGHAELFIGIMFVVFVLYLPEGIIGTLQERAGGSLERYVASASNSPAQEQEDQ